MRKLCVACLCVHVCDASDEDMQSLASLMSLQQQQDSSGSCDVAADVSDVANMADVADEDDVVQTCQPVLSDIQQIVSRSPPKLFVKSWRCYHNAVGSRNDIVDDAVVCFDLHGCHIQNGLHFARFTIRTVFIDYDSDQIFHASCLLVFHPTDASVIYLLPDVHLYV